MLSRNIIRTLFIFFFVINTTQAQNLLQETQYGTVAFLRGRGDVLLFQRPPSMTALSMLRYLNPIQNEKLAQGVKHSLSVSVADSENTTPSFDALFSSRAELDVIYKLDKIDGSLHTVAKIKKSGYYIDNLFKLNPFLKDSLIEIQNRMPQRINKVRGADSVVTIEKEANPYDFRIGWIQPTHTPLVGLIPDFEMKRVYRHASQASSSNSPYMNTGEIIGRTEYVWETIIWPFAEYEEKIGRGRHLVFTDYPPSKFHNILIKTRIDELIKRGMVISIDQKLVKILKTNFSPLPLRQRRHTEGYFLQKSDREKFNALLSESSQPFDHVMDIPNDSQKIADFQISNIPICCIDPQHHTTRLDKNDWTLKTNFNLLTGDFYQKLFFSKFNEAPAPFHIRDFALDYCAGVVNCKQSTVGVVLSKQKVISPTSGNFSSANLIQSLAWSPRAVPTAPFP